MQWRQLFPVGEAVHCLLVYFGRLVNRDVVVFFGCICGTWTCQVEGHRRSLANGRLIAYVH